MSSINLKVLKQIPTEVKTVGDQTLLPSTPFTYNDIHIDLDINQKDIKVGYDLAAIKHSLENLFNSVPGQWILNPTLGVGLPAFLFHPVDEHTGKQIAEAIVSNITAYEPRVRVQSLKVVGDPDSNSYEITMAIQMVNVNNSNITLNGTLNGSKFEFNN